MNNKEMMIYVGVGFVAVVVIFLLYKNAKPANTSPGVGTPGNLSWGEEFENELETGNSQGFTSYGQGTLPTFLGITY